MRSFGVVGSIDMLLGSIQPIFLKFGFSISLLDEKHFSIGNSSSTRGEVIALETELVAVFKHLNDVGALDEETIHKLKELSLKEFYAFLTDYKTKLDETSSYFIGSSMLQKGKRQTFFDKFFHDLKNLK